MLTKKNSNTLNLCDSAANYGAPQCIHAQNCPGASSSYCYPYYVYTSSGTAMYLGSGNFASGGLSGANAGSVRCVRAADMPEHCLIADGSDKCQVCKTGYKLSGTNCVLDLDTTIYNGLTIVRANAGDKGGAPIPDDVALVDVGQSCTPNALRPCCWKGATVSTNYDNTSATTVKGSVYSGGGRTVCDWYAANMICNSIGYRLPTSAEAASWRNVADIDTVLVTSLSGTKSSSLGLCDYYASYGAPYCGAGTSLCTGATTGHCYPSRIWTSSSNDGGTIYYYLEQSLFKGPASVAQGYAYSVRCVK